MDLSNINDPVGIKALLDKLRNSQAWQETIATQTPDPAPVPAAVSAGSSNDRILRNVDDPPTGSVAALLSLLQPASPGQTSPSDSNLPQQTVSSVIAPSRTYDTSSANHETQDSSLQLDPPLRTNDDLRSCSFQEALSHLARLSSDPEFKRAVFDMKQEQADLEQQLWDERRAILQKYESKVKLAVTKANLIGSEGLSQYEADVMTEACKTEMSKFDRNRVLPAWDGLVSKQQAMLQSLNCPLMYVTNMAVDTQRQQRIIRVLESISDE